jgi:hypothetical protein
MGILEDNIKKNLEEVRFLQDTLKGKVEAIEVLTERNITEYYKTVANLGLLYLKIRSNVGRAVDEHILLYYESLKDKGLQLIPTTDMGSIAKIYYNTLHEISLNKQNKTISSAEEKKGGVEGYYDEVKDLSLRKQGAETRVTNEELEDTEEYYNKVTELSSEKEAAGKYIANEELEDVQEYYDEVATLSAQKQNVELQTADEELEDTQEYYDNVNELSAQEQESEVASSASEIRDTQEYYDNVNELSNRNKEEEAASINGEVRDTQEYYNEVTELSYQKKLEEIFAAANKNNKLDTYYNDTVGVLSDGNKLKQTTNSEALKTEELTTGQRTGKTLEEISAENVAKQQKIGSEANQATESYYKEVAQEAAKQKIPFRALFDRIKNGKIRFTGGGQVTGTGSGGSVGVEFAGFHLDLSVQKYYTELNAKSQKWLKDHNIKRRYTLGDVFRNDPESDDFDPNSTRGVAIRKDWYKSNESLANAKLQKQQTSDYFALTEEQEKQEVFDTRQYNSKEVYNNKIERARNSMLSNEIDSVEKRNSYFETEPQRAVEESIYSNEQNFSTYSSKTADARNKLRQSSAIKENPKEANDLSQLPSEEINEIQSEKVKSFYKEYHPPTGESGVTKINSNLLSNQYTFPKPGEPITTQSRSNGERIAKLNQYTFAGGAIPKGTGVNGMVNPHSFGTADVPYSRKLESMLEEYRRFTPGSYKFFIEKLHGRHASGDFYAKNPIKKGLLRSDIPNRMVFPAYINNYNDSYDVNWQSYNFYGRSEPFGIYNSTSRQLSISFFMVSDFSTEMLLAGVKTARDRVRLEAEGKDPNLAYQYGTDKAITNLIDNVGTGMTEEETLEELRNFLPEWGTGSLGFPVYKNGKYTGIGPGKYTGTPEMMWSRLTFLAQCCYPWYRNDGKMKEQPMVRIRIGDFIDSTARITRMSVDDYESLAVDLNPSKVGTMPMGITVTLGMEIIHDDEPSSEYARFYHRKDYDTEDAYYIPDSLKSDSNTSDSELDILQDKNILDDGIKGPVPVDEDGSSILEPGETEWGTGDVEINKKAMYASINDLKTNINGLRTQGASAFSTASDSSDLRKAGASHLYKKAVSSSQAVVKNQYETLITNPLPIPINVEKAENFAQDNTRVNPSIPRDILTNPAAQSRIDAISGSTESEATTSFLNTKPDVTNIYNKKTGKTTEAIKGIIKT